MADIHVQPETRRGHEPGPAPPEPGGGGEPSISELFRQLAQDSTTLIRQEVALAKTEVRDSVRTAARDLTMVAAGGAIAATGALVLTAFLVLVLGALLANYWLAALIVGLLFLLMGGGIAWSNLGRLRSGDLKPEHTIDSLKEDKAWLQDEIRDAKRELR